MVVSIVTSVGVRSIRLKHVNHPDKSLESWLCSIKTSYLVNALDITFDSEFEYKRCPLFVTRLADNLYIRLDDNNLRLIKDRFSKHNNATWEPIKLPSLDEILNPNC